MVLWIKSESGLDIIRKVGQIGPEYPSWHQIQEVNCLTSYNRDCVLQSNRDLRV